MPTPLDQWQERLETHFRALSQQRAGSKFPLFSLEHGLTEEELEDISAQLRSRHKAGLRLRPHWLLWAIYATERGYNYEGDEYWRSFEEQTPNWDFADRDKVVPWFKKFRANYNGVQPSGRWARKFKIIAWPITHAILPRYLQVQFAKALYDLRFRLAGLESLEPAAIGRMLAANAHYSSTRFEQFLQQEELTGRIVLALLHRDPAQGLEPIYKPTLERIASDLEAVRTARDWLRDTQHVVTDRFKGIGRGTGLSLGRSGETTPPEPPEHGSHPDIRPHLLLRYAGGGNWSLMLEVPSFKSIAALRPDIRSFLRRTRCRLNGADDPKPPAWLLSGKRRGALNAWPDPDKPLVQFERSHGIIDHILEADCRMSPGPVWLFKIGGDGTARAIAGRIVRPGSEYIVVTTGELPPFVDGMSGCSVTASGINAARLAVPENISADYAHWLDEQGLHLARTIHVWPAGLPARGWDGEGSSEWLTTETPCFGIVHDHPVDRYVLQLDNEPATDLDAGGVGHPSFVRLPRLPAGMHRLTVRADRSGLPGQTPMVPAEGYVELRVREPEPWTPGVASHTGLIVTLDPYDTNLDTFWDNNLTLSVVGPESHQVTFTLTLENARGETILSELIGGATPLPATPQTWSKRFAQFAQREEVAWRYLESAAGTLTISADDLGAYTLRFERDVQPLRWVAGRSQGEVYLRLIDDSGSEDTQPTCLFFDMEQPARPYRRNPTDLRAGITVPPPGGLFVAQQDKNIDRIIVSAGLAGEGLQGLNVNPDLNKVRNGTVGLSKAFRIARQWHIARFAGFLSDIRRQRVADSFVSAIYEALTGTAWARAEETYLQDPRSDHTVENLQRRVGERSGFAAVLRRDYAMMNEAPDDRVRWFADVAARYKVCRDHNLSRFTLRLAGDPFAIARVYRDELDDLLDRLRTTPALLRGARLLALLSANEAPDAPPALTPGWTW